jgi:NitT/TauT family transport system permease protein
VLALIGVLLFWILYVIERWSIPWHASQRQDIVIAA